MDGCAKSLGGGQIFLNSTDFVEMEVGSFRDGIDVRGQ